MSLTVFSSGTVLLSNAHMRPVPVYGGHPAAFLFIAMNLRKTMCKLQTALNMSGRRVKINQFQSWSDLQKRMVTKFVIIEDGETVLETYQTVEAVKTLADMLGGD